MKEEQCFNFANQRKAAFTLAEVLITLGIIGVVAAMTLPAVMNNTKNKELETQLKKSYSVLQNAINLMNYERGELVIPANTDNAVLGKELKKYLNLAKDCGIADCESKYGTDDNGELAFNYSDHYRTYNNAVKMNNAFLDDGQFILTDSMFIMIECSGYAVNKLLLITVDVNGYHKGPNRWGHDLFTFQITANGKFLPAGAVGTSFTSKNLYCSETSTSTTNGIGCTYSALTDKDYWKNLPK